MESKTCDYCNGHGVVLTDRDTYIKCVCTAKRELQAYITERYLPAHLNKQVVIDILKGTLWLKGDFIAFNAFVKSVLFKYYFTNPNPTCWASVTGNEIVDMYLESNGQTRLYNLDLLFVDLSKSHRNKSIGEIVAYLAHYRDSHNTYGTYLFTGMLEPVKIADMYSPDFLSMLQELNCLDANQVLAQQGE